jgi:PKD domain-containing protein
VTDPDQTLAYDPNGDGVPLSIDPRGSSAPEGDPITCTVTYYASSSNTSSCRVIFSNERAFVPGIYRITLLVTDAAGATSTATKAITVVAPGHPPPSDGTSKLDAGPDRTVRAGETVVFDFSSSWLEDGNKAGEWGCDFGDGGPAQPRCGATFLDNKHVFTAPGTYTSVFTAELYSPPPWPRASVNVTVVP